MQRALEPWPVRPGDPDGTLALAAALRAALAGDGPALAPYPDDAPGRAAAAALPARVDDEVALVVRTSGSTGGARWVLLDATALRASATATHARLGGGGTWLLALPVTHVAGLQVLVRSVLAGRRPVVVDPDRPLVEALGRALDQARRAQGARRTYLSLVPTQLHRLVAAGGLPGPLPDAVLVGGAGTDPTLLERARDLGLRVVTTYGSTETSGGCVYDGVPLEGVRVALDEGVVLLGGPVLARGYLPTAGGGAPSTEAPFVLRDGARLLRTPDLGSLDDDGRLVVHGRADDVLVTGGVKVVPAAVEAAVAGLGSVAQVCVVGLPDAEWGQVVTAVVVPVMGGEPPDLAGVREAVRRTLGSASAPRRLVLVDALPVRGPGKVDRVAVGRIAAGQPGDVTEQR